MTSNNKDRQFLSHLMEQYNDCIKRADAYAIESKKALAEANQLLPNIEFYKKKLSIEDTTEVLPIFKPVVLKQPKVEKQTFEDTIVTILADKQPRTTRKLYEEYSKLGKKPVDLKDFSTKLSIRASNGNSRIKNVKFPELPIDQRFWWGLRQWFDGDRMKMEYKSKIYATN